MKEIKMNMFMIGQVLRFGCGSTALFKVEKVLKDHGGPSVHKYYGEHCLGGIVGAYHSECQLANEDDLLTWKANNKWRKIRTISNLKFSTLREFNVDRLFIGFGGHEDWSLADWYMATSGELGELGNLLKKIKRGDISIDNEKTKNAIASEIADVITYIDLLAYVCGIEDLGGVIVRKFNEVSSRRNVNYSKVMPFYEP